MGSSLSTSDPSPNRNTYIHHNHRHHNHHPPPPPYPTAPPPPQPPYFYPPQNPNYGYPPSNPNPPYPTSPQYNYNNYPPPPVPSNYYYPGWHNSFNYPPNPSMGRPNYPYSYGNGWAPQANVGPPPVYVEHQDAKVVKNDVNVHKDSIVFEVDERRPDCRLVSFVFDARFDGSITIYYFAKEDKDSGKFVPVRPEAQPVKVPFREGAGQRFHQPSGTGVNLHRYDQETLQKLSADGVSPLVIFAEVTSSSHSANDGAGESSERAQITHAVIERENDGSFKGKVIKQIVSIDGVNYEVRELYGIGGSSAQDFNDDEPGKECVICMTEPKTTAVMPCRHLCMCSDCAKELRFQSDKCPICRQPISELIEIKINSSDH